MGSLASLDCKYKGNIYIIAIANPRSIHHHCEGYQRFNNEPFSIKYGSKFKNSVE